MYKMKNNLKSRGYSGYYKEIFLRSTLEFIYARYLDIHNKRWLYEKEIYSVFGKNYKPDFFIYDDDKLIKIVEIKYSKQEYLNYVEKYTSFFKTLNIEYLVLYSKNINHIIKDFNLLEEKKNWILESNKLDHTNDMRGELNPMSGVKHNDNTRKLIGAKTKERFADVDYKKSFVEKMKLTMCNKEVREKISTKRKQYIESNQKNKNILNPIIEHKCAICNKLFNKRKNSDETKQCSSACTYKYRFSIGLIKIIKSKSEIIIAYKHKIFKVVQLIPSYETCNIDEILEYCKVLKLHNKIQKNFGLSEKTIIKYFGEFKNLIEEMKNWQNLNQLPEQELEHQFMI